MLKIYQIYFLYSRSLFNSDKLFCLHIDFLRLGGYFVYMHIYTCVGTYQNYVLIYINMHYIIEILYACLSHTHVYFSTFPSMCSCGHPSLSTAAPANETPAQPPRTCCLICVHKLLQSFVSNLLLFLPPLPPSVHPAFSPSFCFFNQNLLNTFCFPGSRLKIGNIQSFCVCVYFQETKTWKTPSLLL